MIANRGISSATANSSALTSNNAVHCTLGHAQEYQAYQLCNPTGTVWDKAEYLQRLTTGRLAYSQLETTSEIDVLPSPGTWPCCATVA